MYVRIFFEVMNKYIEKKVIYLIKKYINISQSFIKNSILDDYVLHQLKKINTERKQSQCFLAS